MPLHNNRWIFETYGGLGTGGVINNYGVSESSTAGLTKFFIQPSFGYTSQHFEMAVSSKFSMVNINIRNSTLTRDNDASEFDYIEFLKSSNSFFFWEPGIMIRGGFKQ
ncbi:MAG: hypothetical protein ABJA79_00560, partial [Parafilimonas sp.]